MLILALFFCILVYKNEAIQHDQMKYVQIEVENGILRGNVKPLSDSKVYYSFQAIPYAMPPVGALRFRDPVPYKKWDGILDATKTTPSCVEVEQIRSTFTVHGEEDCLYLNVYTPQNPHHIVESLPVMVWFYGGSFREGNSSLYGPELLLRENVIIVTLNYRLGVFGFLATGDLSSPGNYGLKDQVQALKWIKRNVRQFGGDPSKVTIFGESAGAAAVGFLLISSQGKGLFSGAILQSGSPLCNWALDRNPRMIALELGMAFGITTNNTNKLINYLRHKDLAKYPKLLIDLYKVNTAFSFLNGGPLGPVIEPNYDGAFLTKDSFRALQMGDFIKVPVIIGVNSQEAKFLASVIQTSKPFFFLFDVSPSFIVRDTMNVRSSNDKRRIGRKITEHYFKSGSFIGGTDEEYSEFLTDDMFVRPIIKTAHLISNFTPVYFYVYDYEGSLGKWWLNFKSIYNPRITGVGHATDIFYMWNITLGSPEFRNREEERVSERLTKLWTNFAKYSNPTPYPDKLLQDIRWPKVNGVSLEYLYIGSNLGISRNFRKPNINFWENLYKTFSKGPYQIY